jgi:hypothetical protein
MAISLLYALKLNCPWLSPHEDEKRSPQNDAGQDLKERIDVKMKPADIQVSLQPYEQQDAAGYPNGECGDIDN